MEGTNDTFDATEGVNSPKGMINTRKTIITLVLSFTLISIGMVWSLFKVQSDLVRSSAIQNAEILSGALQEFRILYTSEVIDAAIKHGMIVSHDYKGNPAQSLSQPL